MALALARKYRPRGFEELVGQESISVSLSNALSNERLSHAYLFSGLRGSGKTSTARIFAKALLCQNGPTPKPCDVCEDCKMANENRHLDIIEMDGASNRGIDDIKELIEHTKYKPSSGRFKIFIIDEVHMLTPQAFNALLKTLEEPPEFIKFILATTDPLKLPATILSRVQHFRFKKIPARLIQNHLAHILNLEGIEYEKEALRVLARAGAGSLRDSLTLLDQAIVYSRDKIELSAVSKMLGVIEPTIIHELLESILAKDREKILEFFNHAQEYEAEMVIDELTIETKELLLNGDRRFSPLILDRFFRVLADAKELLHIGGDGEFVLLLTLHKMVEALSLRDVDSLILELEDELLNHSKPKIAKPSTSKSPPKSKPTQPTKAEPKDRFKELINRIKAQNEKLGVVFEESIEFESFEDKTLTWKSKATAQNRKILRDGWGLIRMFVKELFGFDTKIVNIQAPTPEPEPEPKIPENIQESHSQPQESPSQEQFEQMPSSCVNNYIGDTPASKDIDKEAILQEPMIKSAKSLLIAKKVRIIPKV